MCESSVTYVTDRTCGRPYVLIFRTLKQISTTEHTENTERVLWVLSASGTYFCDDALKTRFDILLSPKLRLNSHP